MTESADILDSGREIFKRLVAVENNVVIYPPNHPALIEPAAEICELLEPLFVDRQRVSFSIVNSEIYVEKHLLREESIRHSDFIRLLMDRGVNNLLFDPGVTPESITMFFSFVNVKGEPEGGPGSLKSLIRRAGVVGIGFEELVAFDLTEDVYELKSEPQGVSAAHASYDGALECMETMSHDILSNRGIDIAALNVVISSLMGDFLNKKDAIIGLMSIKNYNEHLFHHSVNVALTCLLIANSLNLTEEMVRTVGVSGLLHDIGKLQVPKDILDKPGKLTDDEWAILKQHPIEGAKELTKYDSLGELPVLAALEHHTGCDHSGYPVLRRKSVPHAISRIISIADVYEAMTAKRSYRNACTAHQAMGVLMDGAGNRFDPLLLKLLLDIVGAFPPGSRVRLRTGQEAVVVEANEGDPFHPIVRPVGADPAEESLINIADDPAKYAGTGIANSAET